MLWVVELTGKQSFLSSLSSVSTDGIEEEKEVVGGGKKGPVLTLLPSRPDLADRGASRNQPTSVLHVRHWVTKLMLLQLLEQNVHLRTFHFTFPCTCSASYFGLHSAAASVDMNIVAESDSGQPARICALSQDIPTPHLIPF